MKYDAETFRQFLLGFEDLKSRAERHQYVKDALKDVDGMLHENSFIRGLSHYLWAQTMGSQENPETQGKVFFHTEERFEAVAGSIRTNVQCMLSDYQSFFYGLIGRINFEAALGQLTEEELESYQKPFPKDIELTIRGRPGSEYVLWKHEGKEWTEVRILLEKI
jgi:hypothetical protein